jgi:hypothetical protein
MLNEGTTATPYTPYNTDTFSLTVDKLLSVGTSVRDKAYLDNGDWFKDAYVGVDTTVLKSSVTWNDLWDLTDTIAFEKDLSSLLDYIVPSSTSDKPSATLSIAGEI